MNRFKWRYRYYSYLWFILENLQNMFPHLPFGIVSSIDLSLRCSSRVYAWTDVYQFKTFDRILNPYSTFFDANLRQMQEISFSQCQKYGVLSDTRWGRESPLFTEWTDLISVSEGIALCPVLHFRLRSGQGDYLEVSIAGVQVYFLFGMDQTDIKRIHCMGKLWQSAIAGKL